MNSLAHFLFESQADGTGNGVAGEGLRTGSAALHVSERIEDPGYLVPDRTIVYTVRLAVDAERKRCESEAAVTYAKRDLLVQKYGDKAVLLP